jgi:hypothetical protein
MGREPQDIDHGGEPRRLPEITSAVAVPSASAGGSQSHGAARRARPRTWPVTVDSWVRDPAVRRDGLIALAMLLAASVIVAGLIASSLTAGGGAISAAAVVLLARRRSRCGERRRGTSEPRSGIRRWLRQ